MFSLFFCYSLFQNNLHCMKKPVCVFVHILVPKFM